MPVKDSDGNLIGRTEKVYATYTYDAWGKLIGITDRNGDSLMNKQATSSALANRNPLRYRGYYYDVETGFYYLQSRYYDPANHRFINADVYSSTDSSDAVSCNMFAYCGNNPLNRSDEAGTWPSGATKLAIGVGAILVGAAVVAATAATGGAAAAFAGALIAGVKTAAISGAVAAGTSAALTAAKSVGSGDDVGTTLKKAATAAVDGFADGFMWGGISFGASRVAGYVTSKTGFFKRKVTYGKNNFMYGSDELTIWRHGPNFRIDASATRGLHYHWRTATVGIGKHRTKWISEIIGGISGVASAIEQ